MYPPFRASWQMAVGPCMAFPLPPLKFRTAGFPQYGFKSAFGRDLRCRRTHAGGLYAAMSLVTRLTVQPRGAIAALCRRWKDSLADASDPEALGSPVGCSVPQGQCLLWPHPRLWFPPDALWSSAAGLCLAELPPLQPETRDSPI